MSTSDIILVVITIILETFYILSIANAWRDVKNKIKRARTFRDDFILIMTLSNAVTLIYYLFFC